MKHTYDLPEQRGVYPLLTPTRFPAILGLLAAVWLLPQLARGQVAGTLVTVVGGGIADGGPATHAGLFPGGTALDDAGNLYIADTYHHRIRKVTPDGTISTVAGTGQPGFSGDGGSALQAQLNQPSDVAVDGAGSLYIADYANQRIRKVSANGTITTYAGGKPGGSIISNGVPATQAQLKDPDAVAVDGKGNLYIADGGTYRVRRVSTDGIIATVAGDGSSKFNGDDIPAVGAGLVPSDIALDASGNLFIADYYTK